MFAKWLIKLNLLWCSKPTVCGYYNKQKAPNSHAGRYNAMFRSLLNVMLQLNLNCSSQSKYFSLLLSSSGRIYAQSDKATWLYFFRSNILPTTMKVTKYSWYRMSVFECFLLHLGPSLTRWIWVSVRVFLKYFCSQTWNLKHMLWTCYERLWLFQYLPLPKDGEIVLRDVYPLCNVYEVYSHGALFWNKF